MNLIRKAARNTVFPMLFKAGFDKILRFSSGNNLLNLMYHGVTENNTNYFNRRNIIKAQFIAQLKYFRDNFDIISLREAFEIIEGNHPLKRKTLTISFDDGLRNNLITALPLTEQLKIPVTFFISSVCAVEMKVRCIWSELISALNHFYPGEQVKIDHHTFINLIDSQSKINLFDYLKKCRHDERDAILDELTGRYDLISKLNRVPHEIWELLSREELIKLSKSPYVEIGSHGHNHYNLAEIDPEIAKNELVISKELLESTLNRTVDMIAYPDGSYNHRVKELAVQAGYRYHVAVDYQCENDRFEKNIINRHGIFTGTTIESNLLFINYAFIQKGIKTG